VTDPPETRSGRVVTMHALAPRFGGTRHLYDRFAIPWRTNAPEYLRHIPAAHVPAADEGEGPS